MLIDTGPIVAVLNAADPHHEWAKEQFGLLPPPLLTCEAIITEAFHIVRRIEGGSEKVLDLVDHGVIGWPSPFPSTSTGS